jgi:DNA polymerase
MSEFVSHEIVLGDGNVDSDIMLIGEAPGKEEVNLSKPFVGAAGKNLSVFLELLDIKRESIFITNAIKYRLAHKNTKTGRIVNRPATRDEIVLNRNFLIGEIKVINPKCRVTLGNVPLRAVTRDYKKNIGKVHGDLAKIQIEGMAVLVFPLYHPASIIYNRSIKETYLEDIKKLKLILSKLDIDIEQLMVL